MAIEFNVQTFLRNLSRLTLRTSAQRKHSRAQKAVSCTSCFTSFRDSEVLATCRYPLPPPACGRLHRLLSRLMSPSCCPALRAGRSLPTKGRIRSSNKRYLKKRASFPPAGSGCPPPAVLPAPLRYRLGSSSSLRSSECSCFCCSCGILAPMGILPEQSAAAPPTKAQRTFLVRIENTPHREGFV